MLRGCIFVEARGTHDAEVHGQRGVIGGVGAFGQVSDDAVAGQQVVAVGGILESEDGICPRLEGECDELVAGDGRGRSQLHQAGGPEGDVLADNGYGGGAGVILGQPFRVLAAMVRSSWVRPAKVL